MAVSITTVLAGVNAHVAEVEASADADTSATIPHGLSAAPDFVALVPLQAAARTSDWIATTIDGTNIVVEKTTGAGSGAAGAQLRVVASLPHSIVR